MADNTTKKTRGPGYETSDANIRPLLQAGIFIAALVVVTLIGMVALFKLFNFYQPLSDQPVSPLADTRPMPPGPRLQIDPPRQKAILEADEERRLKTYDWVDREARVVRIPIARALELLAEGHISAQPGQVVR